MPAKTFSLMLVRHGQTSQNKLKIIQGQMETQLTDLGREQARLLGEFFKANENKFDKVYCSDLVRALDTCKIALNNPQNVITSQKLRERSFGILQGLSLDKLREEAARAGYDETNYTQFRPEGGETVDDVNRRIVEFCEEELFPKAQNGSSVIIVTHGGVIREFMKYFKREGCYLENRDLFITPNTGMNSFEVKINDRDKIDHVCIKFLHEIPHLSQQAKSEALAEEQLNESGHNKKTLGPLQN